MTGLLGNRIATMFKLHPSETVKVESLFEGMGYHLGLYAVLHGGVSGEVIVDFPKQPHTALVSIYQRQFFLAGSPHNSAFIKELRNFFAGTIYPRFLEKHEKAFLVHYPPGDWPAALADIFPGVDLIHAERQYYEYTHLHRDRFPALPAGFELRSVDRVLLASQDLKNMDALVEEMCSERDSVEDFLQNSFGFCVIYQGEIAGVCLSEYNYLDRCEVGIFTMEEFRRRGLATVLISTLIEYAGGKGINRIGWHCFSSNTPSVATALKVGFVKQADYPVCIVHVPPG